MTDRLATRARAMRPDARVAYVVTVVYALVFVTFAVARYYAFGYARFDLGNMSQAIWTTAHGHFFETTSDAGGQMSRLGAHTDVFLALFAPIWLFVESPLILVVVQVIAVSAGALPVFWLARKHLGGGRVPVFFALIYLLYPATQYNAYAPLTGFHSISIALPLLLYAVWFLDEDRLVAFAIVGMLAATTKEEVPLVVGLLGIWYAKRSGRWSFGLPVFVVGLAVTLFNFLYVLPHYAGGAYLFSDRYADVGGSPGGIARTLFTDPSAFARDVATWHKVLYLLLILGPFLALWVLEPWLMLAAVPDLVLNLLSTRDQQTSLEFHYDATIAPIVIAATILGLEHFGRQTRRIAASMLVIALGISVLSPLQYGDLSAALPGNATRSGKAHALSLVPGTVVVSATNHLGGYLSNRRRILNFPDIGDATWVVIDLNDLHAGGSTYRDMLTDPRWHSLYFSHGVTVFRLVSAKPDAAGG